MTAGLKRQWNVVDVLFEDFHGSTTLQSRPLQLLAEVLSSGQSVDSVSKELIEKSENKLDKKDFQSQEWILSPMQYLLDWHLQ